jgi:hypothetical protein
MATQCRGVLVSYILPSLAYLCFPAGLTPLHAAIANRHWNTAQLVLDMAKAQYVKKEVKGKKFRIKGIALGT